MTSYDEWKVLLDDAALEGPAAVALVERVGKKRVADLMYDMTRRYSDGTARDFYGVTGASKILTLYEMLEAELKRIDTPPPPLRPDRLIFRTEERLKREGRKP
jgi:hypothetical protein